MLQHNIVSITFTEALKKVLSYKVQVRATTVWVVQVKQPIQLNSTFFFFCKDMHTSLSLRSTTWATLLAKMFGLKPSSVTHHCESIQGSRYYNSRHRQLIWPACFLLATASQSKRRFLCLFNECQYHFINQTTKWNSFSTGNTTKGLMPSDSLLPQQAYEIWLF